MFLAKFDLRLLPRVVDQVRGAADVAIDKGIAAERVGRQEELHALAVGGGIPKAAPHIPAADPSRAGRHADPIGLARSA